MVLSKLGLKLLLGNCKRFWRPCGNYSMTCLATRDFYIKLNQTDEFSLMFCTTGWVEDSPVLWNDLVKVVQHYQSQFKFNQTKHNTSNDHLVKYHADPLISVKFQFFKDVADMLSPYLLQFLTDAPLMPLVCGALEEIIHHLMRMNLRSTIVAKANTTYELVHIDLNNKENQLLCQLIQ